MSSGNKIRRLWGNFGKCRLWIRSGHHMDTQHMLYPHMYYFRKLHNFRIQSFEHMLFWVFSTWEWFSAWTPNWNDLYIFMNSCNLKSEDVIMIDGVRCSFERDTPLNKQVAIYVWYFVTLIFYRQNKMLSIWSELICTTSSNMHNLTWIAGILELQQFWILQAVVSVWRWFCADFPYYKDPRPTHKFLSRVSC